MLIKIYDKVIALAGRRNAEKYLAIVSFIESSFFPIPPDVMLAPMVIAKPKKWFRLASICTLSSVIGGCIGYAIGFLFWETIGQTIINFYGIEKDFLKISSVFKDYGIEIIFLAGISPLPYKLFTITSGVVGYNLFLFIIVSLIARGIRFFLVAIIFVFVGKKIRYWIEKHFGLFSLAIGVICILIITIIKSL